MFGSQRAGHSPFIPLQDPNLRERPQRRQVRSRGGSLAIRRYERYLTNESKGTRSSGRYQHEQEYDTSKPPIGLSREKIRSCGKGGGVTAKAFLGVNVPIARHLAELRVDHLGGLNWR